MALSRRDAHNSLRQHREDLPMDIVPLGPGFAAELRGVTLADVASDDAAYAATRAAFEEHSVLVFRGQEVTDEIQLAFSRRFGPPEVTKVGSAGTGTHFVILSTIGPDGKVVPPDHRIALRNKANQLWHTDSSFKRAAARPNSSRHGWPSSGSMRACARSSRIPLPGTTTRIRAARSPRIWRAPRSARRCRRNAGAWCGGIPPTAAARSISPRTLTRSRAWSRRRARS